MRLRSNSELINFTLNNILINYLKKMYKSLVLLCVVFCVVIEARPQWQYLPPKPGYVPVYIKPDDTPLEEINLELAEAFHALPSGRSASKGVYATPETPELQADQPQPEVVPEVKDTNLGVSENVIDKTDSKIPQPVERR